MDHFDVIIIGAGPAGTAYALATLAQTSLRVAMLNKASRSGRYHIGESATPSVTHLLKQLDLPYHLTAFGHAPCYGSISQWGGSEVEEQDFIVQGQGNGWHLDRFAFDQWLRDEAQQRGAVLFDNSRLLKLGRVSDDFWGVSVQQDGREQCFTCQFLVDATGRASVAARKMGATRHQIDNLVALTYLTRPNDHHDIAHLTLIESHPLGWWYSAGLPDGRAVVCFMSDADIVNHYHLMNDSVFLRLYHESNQIRYNVPPPDARDKLIVYRAHSGFIDQVAGPGWIAVGDAALGMDPLTSSGINCALADGIAGSEAMIAFFDDGNTQPLREHAGKINYSVESYLQERRRFYRREQRWKDSLFWKRRHQDGKKS